MKTSSAAKFADLLREHRNEVVEVEVRIVEELAPLMLEGARENAPVDEGDLESGLGAVQDEQAVRNLSAVLATRQPFEGVGFTSDATNASGEPYIVYVEARTDFLEEALEQVEAEVSAILERATR